MKQFTTTGYRSKFKSFFVAWLTLIIVMSGIHPTPVQAQPYAGPLQIFVMDRNGSHRVALTNETKDCLYPKWSPDGKHIAYLLESDPSQIFVMDSTGKNRVKLAEAVGYSKPIWSPDSQKVAFTELDNGAVYLSIVDLSSQRKVHLIDQLFTMIDGVVWSPDGKHIAMIANVSTIDINKSKVYIIDADGKNLTALTDILVQWLAWSPDSKQIAYVSFEEAANVYSIDIGTKETKTLIDNQIGSMTQPVVWSPNGKYLAMPAHEGDVGSSDLYQTDILLVRVNSPRLINVTKAYNLFFAQNPAWSPDSQFIAFNVDQGGTTMLDSYIYTLNITINRLNKLTYNQPGSQMPDWSPDGKRIVYSGPIITK